MFVSQGHRCSKNSRLVSQLCCALQWQATSWRLTFILVSYLNWRFHSWLLWLCVWSSFLVSPLFYSLYSCLKYIYRNDYWQCIWDCATCTNMISSDCDAVIRTLEGAAKALILNCEGAEDSLLVHPSVVEMWCVLNKLQGTQNIN